MTTDAESGEQPQTWTIAIVEDNKIKIRVVLRRVGDGHITFWSVMPSVKLKRNHQQKLATKGIEED